MANRPKGYGLTAEIKRKLDSKYDPSLEEDAHTWVAAVLNEDRYYDGQDIKKFQETFKDGILLCRLIKALNPQSNIKYNTSKMAFKMMENIGKFLDEATEYGVSKTDLFQTVDLYESQNLPQVIDSIIALSRKASQKGYVGPSIGPKEATENRREFSEESLREGETIIGLQMGSNKGANQSGIAYGRPRQIQPST